MCEAEIDGIEPGCLGELVHEGFDGEDVAMGAQCPERSVADWCVKEEMIPDLLSRKFIGGNSIAVSIAERLRNARRGRLGKGDLQIPSRKQVDAAGLTRSHRVTIAPQVIRPVDNAALRRKRRLDLRRHGRSERGPRKFVVAHPLELDRPAWHGARNQGGVQGDVVRSVVTVAPGARRMDHVDLGVLHPQHLGEIAPQWKHPLGV